MNIDRLTKLAEWLEAGAKHERIHFDMTRGLAFKITEDFDPKKPADCDTSCCIAGAAVQFFGGDARLTRSAESAQERTDLGFLREDGFTESGWLSISNAAADLLDLDGDDFYCSEKLFEPQQWFGGELEDFNDPAWAARTIRHLIATGEVDWNATRAPVAVEGGAA